jgi:oligopeptide/dipeptide ABC transporter ATP-binding protein
MRAIRGDRIAMIFQDPLMTLNPVLRIDTQMVEAVQSHHRVSRRAALDRACDVLTRVGISSARERLTAYPHQFSGGMRQRVAIAIALINEPDLIIADEPTTALDVTVQDQILKLLAGLQRELRLAVLLVTHDMGVVAQNCQRVAVMYSGRLVELAATEAMFRQPRHPYTAGLLDCVPSVDLADAETRLAPIPGGPPDLADPPEGCRFHPRCPLADEGCRSGAFPLREVAPGHYSACIRHEALARTFSPARRAAGEANDAAAR